MNFFTGIVISGYQIILEPLSVDQILSSAKTCHVQFTDSHITMADLSNGALEEMELIAPSQCDSKYINTWEIIFFLLRMHEDKKVVLAIKTLGNKNVL